MLPLAILATSDSCSTRKMHYPLLYVPRVTTTSHSQRSVPRGVVRARPTGLKIAAARRQLQYSSSVKRNFASSG